jgi:hypothetical protein
MMQDWTGTFCMTSNRIRNAYEKYCVLTDWNIGVTDSSVDALGRLVTRGELSPVRWMPRRSPLLGRADPFLWPLESVPRVIYEEIDQRHGRGQIFSVSLRDGFARRPPRQEIDRPFHMSYPFVLRVDDTWCCIPESARSDGVDLYRWDARTESWQPKSRLIDGVGLLDATIFQQEGLWYLFGTVRDQGSNDALRIWWAPALAGPWQAHARNPVKVDASSARSAGPFFQFDGRWYRPAQDCTLRYGGALAVNRLDALSPTDFAETTVSRVSPDPKGPYPDGLHTLSVYDDCILVDGKRVGFSAALVLMKVRRRISRVMGSAA